MIAAQSIGAPGTQLTMRTFHIGGTATRISEQSKQDAKSDKNEKSESLQWTAAGKERYPTVYGAPSTSRTEKPSRPTRICSKWDPYTFSILTELTGAGGLSEDLGPEETLAE